MYYFYNNVEIFLVEINVPYKLKEKLKYVLRRYFTLSKCDRRLHNVHLKMYLFDVKLPKIWKEFIHADLE